MSGALDGKRWAPFRIGDLFDTSIGKSIDGNKADRTGSVAYVTRRESNNGLDGFIRGDAARLTTVRPVITIGNETAKPFVQGYPFFTGTNVNILRPKEKLSIHALQFVAACMQKQRSKYSYTYAINSTRLKEQIILLPVTADGKPDWACMEAHIRQGKQHLLRSVTERLSQEVSSGEIIEVGDGTARLRQASWRPFYLIEVFTLIQRGARLKKADHVGGDTPYISSTAYNNGVDGFIGNREGVRMFRACLTLANSGSVGSTFFHPYEFVASDHVTQLARPGLDRYAYLFLVTLVKRLAVKYGFNREISDVHLRRERVLLPVNAQGELDFAFMSSFMRGVEARMLSASMEAGTTV